MTRNDILAILQWRRNLCIKDLESARASKCSDETIAHLKGMADGLVSAMNLLTDRKAATVLRRQDILSGKLPNPLTAHLEK